MDLDTIEKVDNLIKLNVGDSQRLLYIRNMLLREQTLYNSDKIYLESLITETNSDSSGSTSNDDIPKTDDVPHKEKVIIRYVYKSSAAWYLLPIFLWLIGGIISYVCLRKRDPGRARNTLILGSVLFVVPVLITIGIGLQLADDANVSSTDLNSEQIKSSALLVPYNSLMDNSDQYVGEIIHYEGQIVQAQEQFQTFVLRISTSLDTFASDDVIWTKYVPKTDAEREWLEKLAQENNPFTAPNSDNVVQVWGKSQGLEEYSGILGNTIIVPKVDAWIIERSISDIDHNSTT